MGSPQQAAQPAGYKLICGRVMPPRDLAPNPVNVDHTGSMCPAEMEAQRIHNKERKQALQESHVNWWAKDLGNQPGMYLSRFKEVHTPLELPSRERRSRGSRSSGRREPVEVRSPSRVGHNDDFPENPTYLTPELPDGKAFEAQAQLNKARKTMLTTSSLAMKEIPTAPELYTSVMKADITPKADRSYFALSAPAVGASPQRLHAPSEACSSPERDVPPLTFRGYVPTSPCRIAPPAVPFDVEGAKERKKGLYTSSVKIGVPEYDKKGMYSTELLFSAHRNGAVNTASQPIRSLQRHSRRDDLVLRPSSRADVHE